jgi:hypothetical protein
MGERGGDGVRERWGWSEREVVEEGGEGMKGVQYKAYASKTLSILIIYMSL